MRLAITGASGFLGQQIVPILQQSGVEMLLLSRTPDALARHFPKLSVTDYENLAQKLTGFDVLLHLATRNNDQLGDLEEFRKVNVTFVRTITIAAQEAGISRLINVTSLQVQPDANASAYAQSKSEGEAYLAEQTGIEIVNLRLPAVYGTKYRGKLAMLNKVPARLRPIAFQILAAFKPTVHVDHVAQAVLNAVAGRMQGTQLISDRQVGNIAFATIKRVIDVTFALFVIVFLWWVLLGAWVAVRLSSPGEAIFAQERIGQHQKTFICYKFRTMHIGTRQAGTHEMSSSSVTRAGVILRKTKIDELPQIWNLLRGNLSLVGPRPGLPIQTELTEARATRGVFNILPGITGWAQIQGIDMSDPELLARTDADYIARRSIPVDLKIILATATGRGQGDKVKS